MSYVGNDFLKLSSGLEVLSKKMNILKTEKTKNWRALGYITITGFGMKEAVFMQTVFSAMFWI